MWRSLALGALIALAAAAPAAAAPTCLTYDAADGHEPVCNPWEMESSWEQAHRNAYSQHTVPVAGPRPGEPVRAVHHGFETVPIPGVVIGLAFSPRYPDGRRAALGLLVTGSNDNPLVKVDYETGALIDLFTHTTEEGSPPSERAALSGIYVISDRHGHLIQPRGVQIEVYGDARPRDRMSPLASLHKFRLPARAMCGSEDRLVGQTMRWDGRVAFITARGMLGVVPSEIRDMDDAHLIVHSINGAAKCATADASTEGLETVSNSISNDEDGGMYPVTSRAQYRFDLRGGRIEQTWRVPYKTGTTSSIRQDSGSGSTPALMGTDPGDDKFVVITDGAPLTNLVLFWRGRIPATWKGLPGRPRRIACELPLRFGDPTVTEAQNEQSVAIRGYAAMIPQNELRNADLAEQAIGPIAPATGLPAQLAFAGLASGDPRFAPHGFARVDWDPRRRACREVWVNKEVSIPNGVPTMSSGSNTVYGLGMRDGMWGLEGLDFVTGRSKLWIPASSDPNANSFFSALSIAPNGSVWSGALQGFTVFRPPARPELRRVCKEFEAPRSAVRAARARRGRLRVRGRARDTGCGGLRRVEVSIARRAGRRCRFVRRSGRLGARRRCRNAVWLNARGRSRWRLAVRRGLPPGRYVARSRARDRAGNVERRRRGARRVVRVR